MGEQGKNDVARTPGAARESVPFWGCSFCLDVEIVEFIG
jgi:hypothetical protein